MIIQNYEYALMVKDPETIYKEYHIWINDNHLESINPKLRDPDSNLYTALLFYNNKEAERFLSIFNQITNFLDEDINGFYSLSVTKTDFISDLNIKSYLQRVVCQSLVNAGTYSFQSTNEWKNILITLDLWRIHGQLVLIVYPDSFAPYPAKFIVNKFFEMLINFKQPKVLEQIKLYKQLPIRNYFQQLITSLLDFQPVDIHGKTYWLNNEQRKDETLIQTLKNESILEKL